MSAHCNTVVVLKMTHRNLSYGYEGNNFTSSFWVLHMQCKVLQDCAMYNFVNSQCIRSFNYVQVDCKLKPEQSMIFRKYCEILKLTQKYCKNKDGDTAEMILCWTYAIQVRLLKIIQLYFLHRAIDWIGIQPILFLYMSKSDSRCSGEKNLIVTCKCVAKPANVWWVPLPFV